MGFTCNSFSREQTKWRERADFAREEGQRGKQAMALKFERQWKALETQARSKFGTVFERFCAEQKEGRGAGEAMEGA